MPHICTYKSTVYNLCRQFLVLNDSSIQMATPRRTNTRVSGYCVIDFAAPQILTRPPCCCIRRLLLFFNKSTAQSPDLHAIIRTSFTWYIDEMNKNDFALSAFTASRTKCLWMITDFIYKHPIYLVTFRAIALNKSTVSLSLTHNRLVVCLNGLSVVQ